MNNFLSFLFGKTKQPKNEPKIESRFWEGMEAYKEARKILYAKDSKVRNDEKALSLFDLAFECGFDIDGFYSDRAFCLQGLNYHYDAIEDFDKAILKSKNDANLFYGRGHSKYMIAEYDSSIADLKIAIELAKLDNKLNKDYDEEMRKSGWSSVAQYYIFQLQYILEQKSMSEEPHQKEFFEKKLSEIVRRNK